MKLNMILGKKQIVLASLILILGVAVYINWNVANNDASLATSGSVDSGVSTSDTDAEKN